MMYYFSTDGDVEMADEIATQGSRDGLGSDVNRPDADRADGHSLIDEEFLAQLGQRVRRIRALRGMSRKVLAEASDVSERYIAQLEAGMGNVSVLLLRRLAKAAGVTLDDLINDTPAEIAWFRDLLRTASLEAVERAKAILRGDGQEQTTPEPSTVVDRVALIGLRGAGKSTLGRLAAKRLRWSFVELNREVEREAGFSMPEIFKLFGQEGYRRWELKALRKICARRDPMILATGGGIVSEAVTFELLLSSFFTMWIKASPEEHMARVRRQGDLRPMANERGAMDELRTILSSREPLYARALAVVDTSGRSIDVGVNDILSIIDSQHGQVSDPKRTAQKLQPRPIATAQGGKNEKRKRAVNGKRPGPGRVSRRGAAGRNSGAAD
jgi:XRE family aerobic/anaerobic benzoate catabolism transcriptional regulator